MDTSKIVYGKVFTSLGRIRPVTTTQAELEKPINDRVFKIYIDMEIIERVGLVFTQLTEDEFRQQFPDTPL